MAQDEHPSAQHSPNASRIGKSMIWKGEISGSEDIEIEGVVIGHIDLGRNDVVVHKDARVEAEVRARNITIDGEVIGNVFASERVLLSEAARLRGDISAATISIQAGAQFRGGIKMARPEPTAP
jgi:cytoskeletal protein CcmA (bactofilin family)